VSVTYLMIGGFRQYSGFFPTNTSDGNTHEPVVDIIVRQIT